MAQLVRACRGLYDLARAYQTPLVSGKDSMKNDSTMGGVKISVPPTLLVSAMGQIDDVSDALTLDVKTEGDVVYLLGTTKDETGGSEYFRLRGELDGLLPTPAGRHRYVGNRVPTVDAGRTLPLYRALESAIKKRLVRSAVTPALGGLALALSRCRHGRSASASMWILRGRPTSPRFPPTSRCSPNRTAGSSSRWRKADASAFESLFAGLPCRRIGTVTSTRRLTVAIGGRIRIDVPIAAMKSKYKKTLAHV